eukprot:4423476-Ditylum_brightwellii.AAC.1
MVHREGYTDEINRYIFGTASPNNAVVYQWMVENGHTMEGIGVPAVDYDINISTKSFGEDDKVEATTFKVVCKYTDGLYLKSIMATTWARTHKPCRVFVPARAELLTSPATYKQLLCNHNTYVDSVTGVIFEGRHPDIMKKEITAGDNRVTV